MRTTISNDNIVAIIDHKGAELKSLFHRKTNLEYIWNGDPKFWAKSSPVLFPIVGQLRNNTYYFDGKAYTLPRHGFAREMSFMPILVEDDKAVFVLKSDSETLKSYPFEFELRLAYRLNYDGINVEYDVLNLSKNKMYFSLGGHPAFNVPLIEGTTYNDHYLKFSATESSVKWPVMSDGTIGLTPEPFLFSDRLKLSKDLFINDALVFKDLVSSRISIRSDKHSHGVDFSFKGFPYFGIWAARDADFVCLEPWCGIADSVHHDQRLENKEGIHVLDPGNTWSRDWSISCF